MISKKETSMDKARWSVSLPRIKLSIVQLVSKLNKAIILGLARSLTTPDLIQVSRNLSGNAIVREWLEGISLPESVMSTLGSRERLKRLSTISRRNRMDQDLVN